jgi:hypothetical protein
MDRLARPEYYAQIEKFGQPLSMKEVIGYVGGQEIVPLVVEK